MSRPESVKAAVGVECIVPILRVKSVAESMRFYTEQLGFQFDWGHPAAGPFTFGEVSRDGHAIMLCEGCQGRPGTWLWIGVENIEPLFAKWRKLNSSSPNSLRCTRQADYRRADRSRRPLVAKWFPFVVNNRSVRPSLPVRLFAK